MKFSDIKYNLLLLLTAMIWGVAFVAQSVGMDYVEPFTFNAVRNILAGLFLLPCIAILKRTNKNNEEKSDKKSSRYVLIGGICCGSALFLASTAQQIGIKYTTVGKAGFITALYIVLVPILGLFFKKKVPLTAWLGVVLAVSGLYLLCINTEFKINGADALIMLCAFFYSVHILCIDHFSPRVDGVKMSCIQFFICALLSIIFMLIFEHPVMSNILMCWLPIGYAGIFSSGVAYTLQIIAQKHTQPTVASLILSMESMFAALSGWVLLNESLSKKELLGCALIFIAVILAQLPSNKSKAGNKTSNL